MLGLPRTRLGWARLLKTALRRCWYCNGPTYADPWRYVGGSDGRMCFRCGGVENPRGILHALRQNRHYHTLSTAQPDEGGSDG